MDRRQMMLRGERDNSRGLTNGQSIAKNNHCIGALGDGRRKGGDYGRWRASRANSGTVNMSPGISIALARPQSVAPPPWMDRSALAPANRRAAVATGTAFDRSSNLAR
jgi:hypothetical protein